MNILEKRLQSDDVLNLISDLRFGKKPIELVGSASLRNQRYFSDFDFFSTIGKSSPLKTFGSIQKIISKVNNNPNYYPIELKVQLDDGQKLKYFQPITLNFKEFKKNYNVIDFIKLDLVMFSDSRFVEVSIIYKLNSAKKLTTDEYVRDLKNDIKDLQKEKSFYKILKREFNLARVENNRDLMIELMKFFNSDIGKLYQYKSNLEAVKLIEEHYKKDKKAQQKVEVNFKKIKPIGMDQYKDLTNVVNGKAFEFMAQHNINL